MLTAKGEESDIVRGLNMGADDYIPKPFSPRVLIARAQGSFAGDLHRRNLVASAKAEEPICIHEIVIHLGRHEVLVDGESVELTSTEFRVLNFLARRPGWVFTREQILDAVHGDNYAITDRAVDVQVVGSCVVSLGKAGQYIENRSRGRLPFQRVADFFVFKRTSNVRPNKGLTFAGYYFYILRMITPYDRTQRRTRRSENAEELLFDFDW